MENKFLEVMSKRTDSELVEIVTKNRADYQAEAIVAAEIEIKKRNLTIEQIEVAKNEITNKEAKKEAQENEPLTIVQKILFSIFFWGVFPWLIAMRFKADGYTKKYRDAWKFIKYGFLGLIIFLILLAIYSILEMEMG